MKTIVPAVLLSLTASSAALAADNDLTALIEAAKKKVKYTVLECQILGLTGKELGKISKKPMD